MKRFHLLLAGLLLPAAVLAACARGERPAAGEEGTGQEMEMASGVDMAALASAADQIETAFSQAYARGDAAAVADLYTDDAVQVAPDGTVRKGHDAIQAETEAAIGQMGTPDVTITRQTLDASGDIAYSTGHYEITGQVEGQAQPLHVEGQYLVVLKRAADGTWKIAAHAWNESAPGEMGSDAAMKN